MPKYDVYVIVDAGFALPQIEAENAEAAAKIARSSLDEIGRPYNLCHECSGDLDVGDPVKLVIGVAGGTKTDEFEP